MSVQSRPAADAGADELRARLAEQLEQTGGENGDSPLSFAQQRLWFLDQLQPDTPLYNIPSVARLTGTLNLPALQQALNAVVARHESLRTRFLTCAGEPAQVVDPVVRLRLEVENLSANAEPDSETALCRRVNEETRRPFNLSTDHLLRANLLRLGPEAHVLILNMHHIVSDEWSYGIFYRELAAFYGGFRQGKEVELPELPIQYADFAHWQRDWLRSKACDEQLRFWTEQLRDAPLALDLPADRSPGSGATCTGTNQCLMLDAELSRALKALARTRHVTLFMLLLTAFKVLLYRFTEREDLIVGVPVSGRSRVETENLIGLFVNTVPLRTRLGGDMPFEQLLMQERETALAAFSNQDLPFDKLVEALRPERTLSRTPFINVMFIFQAGLGEPLQLPGLRLQFLPAPTGTAKFDLTLAVADAPQGLVLGIEYTTDLFGPETIAGWLKDFRRLLGCVVENPAQRISQLPALDLEERYQKARAGSRVEALRLGPSPSPVPPESPVLSRCRPQASTPGTDGAEVTSVEPRDLTERRLQQVWQQVLEVPRVGVHDKFFALGGHSLLAVRLVAEVEKAFGKKLRVSSVFQHPTIEQFATLLRNGTGPRTRSALVEIQPHGSRPPLVLVHGAGGGMFWGYSNLARHLGPDQPVLAFKSRGLDGFQEFATVERMAEAYLADLRAVQQEGPYYLGGYCFGGVVAFEVARRLQAQGQRVALLALLNSGAPNSSYAQLHWTPGTMLRFAINVGRRLVHFAACPGDKLLGYLRWKAGIAFNRVCGRLQVAAAKRLRANVDDWLDLTQFGADQRQVWHTHIRALELYHPKPYLGSLTLFRSPVHGLYCSFDPKCGWGDYALGGVNLRVIPGAHETIMEEPRVRRLAAEIHKVLTQARLLQGSSRAAPRRVTRELRVS